MAIDNLPDRLNLLYRRSSAVCLRISRSNVRLMAARDELVISKSRTFLSLLAFAASSFIFSREFGFVGLWSSCGEVGISSGVETGNKAVIKFNGVVGVMTSAMLPPDILLVTSPLEDPILVVRPCAAVFLSSMLALLAATVPPADWPLPKTCGRGNTGEGSGAALRSEDTDEFWFNFDGLAGLGVGESVPGAFALANLGEVILDEEETVELALGGAKCGDGEACKSSVPFA